MNNKKERMIKLLTERFKGIFDKDLERYTDMIENYSLDELKEHFKNNELRVHINDDLPQSKIDLFKNISVISKLSFIFIIFNLIICGSNRI